MASNRTAPSRVMLSSTRQSGAPVWAAPVCLVLTAVGIGIATYLTIAHYDTHVSLVCAAKGAIDCQAVTTSAQSKVFGLPVALLGLAYYIGMVPWQLPVAWRSADPRIKFGRLLYGLAGIGFVCYLVYAEAVIIKKICLWCTGVHVVTLLIFVVTAFASALAIPYDAAIDDDDDDDADL